MIGIIDYGMGNLRSVQKAMENVGAATRIVTRLQDLEGVDKLVLPGVGAMKPAMEKLEELRFVDAIKSFVAGGRPFLGICLGFQLLFDLSREGGDVKGLGILRGTVERFPDSVKVPQMGWNQLRIVQKDCRMYKDVGEGAFVYFAHSYYAKPDDLQAIATFTDYGFPYTSSVCQGNVWGVQFHPEKSQEVGLKILENFVVCG